MAKFKVGDKVRILDASKIVGTHLRNLNTGDICEVIYIELDKRLNKSLVIENEKIQLPLFESELQYIEKVKNNQRITALEKEVAELRLLKEKVEHLEQAAKQYFVVPGEPSTVDDKQKTASQEANDFQKLFSVLEEGHDLGVIELPLYVFDLPDSYKERVFKIYQILRDGKTPNVYAYAILDMVRAAFDLTER